MKIYDFEQQSEEWFAIRRGKFSASTAQAIATNGKGLETIVYTKVAEILTGKSDNSYQSPDLDRGNEMETVARSSYEMETGNLVKTVGFIELNEYVGCSPDGLVGDDGLVEIKCPRDYKFVQLLHTKKIDTKYLWQMQFQLYVTGRKWVDFVAFHDNFSKLFIQRVERDEKKIDKIKEGLDSGIKLLKQIMEEI